MGSSTLPAVDGTGGVLIHMLSDPELVFSLEILSLATRHRVSDVSVAVTNDHIRRSLEVSLSVKAVSVNEDNPRPGNFAPQMPAPTTPPKATSEAEKNGKKRRVVFARPIAKRPHN